MIKQISNHSPSQCVEHRKTIGEINQLLNDHSMKQEREILKQQNARKIGRRNSLRLAQCSEYEITLR